MSTVPTPFKTVSLFAGAGGLDVGIESAGKFELLAVVELEERFCETLRFNRDAGRFGTPQTKVIQADISKLDAHDFMANLGLKPGELDLLIGGPPCQSWSTAGKRGTSQDPRGQLIWDFLRFVETLQPKYFLMENVRGLLSGALKHRPIAKRPANGGSPLTPEEMPGSAIQTWLRDATGIPDSPYQVQCFEVNAANYGAPQIRERVLFIGSRFGNRISFPEPTHGPHSESQKPYRSLRDAIGDFTETNPVLVDFSERKKFYLRHVPEGGNWRALPDELAKESMGRAYFAKGGRSGWWRRLSWDLPSPTITTLPSHSSTSLCHPTETRALSVAECARVQEFPGDWEFAGSAQEQMKQVGNAVPVRLGKVAGEVIANLLEENPKPMNFDLPLYEKHYLHSHVRTRSWWKDGKAVVLT